ncbi:glycosyltransferase [candidate division WWE3 bacterium]|jgi:glycosyltransferase involved in cell wall biosynthesis|nr:glycosyltransferase [candidate division WWE3 bacterium]MBT7349472.1 glycosyltransferase [candidate division WWE3 bacterium]
MLVSVIVPAYKQEETIQQNIEEILSALGETRWEYELLVVVDGTVDNTFEEASKIIHPNVSVIGYEQNRGKGYAVKYGMTQARGDYVAFIDAGMDISSNSISMILEHMVWYNADIIVGSKRHPASKVSYPFLRKVYSWGYYTFVRILFGLKVTDTQTGLKVYKREVLDAVLPRLLIKEFAFDIELLSVAKKLGFNKIYEAPIELFLGFDQSNFSKSLLLDSGIRKMVIDTLAVFYRLRVLRYYDDSNSYKWLQHDIAQLLAASVPFPMITKPEFSIIIPARTITDYLKENFSYLKKLDYDNFEVILIFDTVVEKPADLDERFRFIDNVGNLGPGEKRNMGAELADGNILVFLDDDAYPERRWLRHASDIFRNSNVYALGAPAMTPKDAGFLERLGGRLLESTLVSYSTVYRHMPLNPRKVDDYPTVNLFVRKDAFMAVGGFITEFWPGEDTKLCLDLVNKFQRPFEYDPRPIVYHHRRNVLVPHLKQISRYGQHRGQFARLFPQTSRLLSYFIPSLFVLGLLTGPVVSSFIPQLWGIYIGILGLYAFLVLQQSIRVVLEEKMLLAGLFMIVGIIATHVIYGANFIVGFIRKPKLKLHAVDLTTGNYLGG